MTRRNAPYPFGVALRCPRLTFDELLTHLKVLRNQQLTDLQQATVPASPISRSLAADAQLWYVRCYNPPTISPQHRRPLDCTQLHAQ